MDYGVINVGAFASDEVCSSLVDAARRREAALDKCYAIEGYAALPLEEKNAIYDKMMREV